VVYVGRVTEVLPFLRYISCRENLTWGVVSRSWPGTLAHDKAPPLAQAAQAALAFSNARPGL
jgi:hypothetical protein